MSETEKVLRRAGFTDSAAEVARLTAQVEDLTSELTEANRMREFFEKGMDETQAKLAVAREALHRIVKADYEAIAELRKRGLAAADYDPVITRDAREALAKLDVPAADTGVVDGAILGGATLAPADDTGGNWST